MKLHLDEDLLHALRYEPAMRLTCCAAAAFFMYLPFSIFFLRDAAAFVYSELGFQTLMGSQVH
jgi:hypothetical protein